MELLKIIKQKQEKPMYSNNKEIRDVADVAARIMAGLPPLEEKLHPNQQKIDVHEPEKDKITAQDFKKLRAMKNTPDGKVHNCATHVEHAVLGKGTTVSEEHAEPDAEGNIEWYTVQFEHSTQQVLTKDLTITMSEAHMHESSEEQVDEEEKKKVVSPFDYKNYTSQIPKNLVRQLALILRKSLLVQSIVESQLKKRVISLRLQ